MPIAQPTAVETDPAASRRITTSISIDRETWDRLHLLADARRATRGGKHSVSAILRDLIQESLQ